MLKSLFVRNYKNIVFLEIPALKRVNLFFGNNNVGKSTILEVLSIFASNGSIRQLYELLSLRGEDLRAFKNRNDITIDDEINALLPLVSNYDKSILDSGGGIQVGENEDSASILQLVRISTLLNKVDGMNQISREVTELGSPIKENAVNSYVALQFSNKVAGLMYQIGLDGSGIKDDGFFEMESVPVNVPFQYVTGNGTQKVDLDQLWSAISMSENEDDVVEALRIIEPNIVKFNILYNDSGEGSRRIPFVRLRGKDQLVRLSSMGDGINRILLIILSLINCKGGIFLLDEFENGLHYSFQERLWKIVFELATKLDIQVFVTTHSNDCISSFSRVASNDNALALRMNHTEGDLTVQAYDNMDDLIFAMNNSIELR